MKKISIFFTLVVLLAMIPLTYVIGRSGHRGGGRGGYSRHGGHYRHDGYPYYSRPYDPYYYGPYTPYYSYPQRSYYYRSYNPLIDAFAGAAAAIGSAARD
jgi:hypothetical protein